MEQEKNKINNWCREQGMKRGGASSGAVYGLGFIGAAIYYIQHADTFLVGALGILKALVWPAFVVYKLFQYFNF